MTDTVRLSGTSTAVNHAAKLSRRQRSSVITPNSGLDSIDRGC
jgi:hypothetical protein